MNNHVKWRLFLVLLLFFFSVTGGIAQEKNITINVKDASLKEVFNAIEKQTTYRFSYRNVIIDSLKTSPFQKQMLLFRPF